MALRFAQHVVYATTMSHLDNLVSIALDLTSAIHADQRYRRLLEALRRVIPYDAPALLRLQDDELVPFVPCRLSPDAMARRFALSEHPRREVICKSAEPVLFPADSDLADPYGWPENGRELDNVLSRVVLKATAHVSRGVPVVVAPTHLGSGFARKAGIFTEKCLSTCHSYLQDVWACKRQPGNSSDP